MMFSVLSRTAGGLTGCFMLTRQMTVKAQQQADPALARSLYEFSARSLEGDLVNFDKYKGQVVVVVNVASK